jgi:Flp pilus assembly protein TadD/predicted Ser/Thr protein kinase
MAGEELVGRTIADGRYEIVRLLGEGGMGAVYQARQVAMDRMVALKLILPEVVKSPAAAVRFQREMKLTAKIEHPNTIRVYDFGETNGQLFLTMELLRGRTLAQELAASGRLDLARIVRIGTQVTRALQAAHSEGIVHRDLKPDNIMLLEQYGERDVVKVLDFGIAKSLDEQEPGMTGAGAVIGTPAYMSAEQAMGEPVDPRSDLYSLGIILYEMASGHVPFTASAFTALLVAHATEAPPPLTQVVRDIPPALATLVEELLRKSPASRPQTAKAVEVRLEALVGGLAMSATMPVPMVAATRVLSGGKARDDRSITDERPSAKDRPSVDDRPGARVAVAADTRALSGGGSVSSQPLKKTSRGLWVALGAVVLVGGGVAALVLGSGGGGAQGTGQGTQKLGSRKPAADVAARLAAAKEKLAGFGDPAPPDACPPDAAADAAELVLEARQAIADDPAKAIAAADKALERCPSAAAAHNVRGNALQKAGKLEDAGDAYARALQFASDYDAPRFNLGVVQLRRHDPAAIATFSEILRRKPDDPDAYKSRAQAYVNAARYDEAAADLEEGLRRKADDGRAWLLLGVIRDQAKKGDANAAYCKAAALGVSEAGLRCKK